ncbi:hypothetical protein LRB60_04965 [Borreliella burgdorferi]|uniref:hypothetical protein n=1 Tax=Borreliella TaxID=64895 RepID=UPI001E2F4862|nr:hypothetical protein [Borreliella burgdorferi]MCD2410003.1 hypothetical protein [Borreliella burgdorferi]MCD2415932.1 hypothetical protein [Borreliella burgdorferi]
MFGANDGAGGGASADEAADFGADLEKRNDKIAAAIALRGRWLRVVSLVLRVMGLRRRLLRELMIGNSYYY